MLPAWQRSPAYPVGRLTAIVASRKFVCGLKPTHVACSKNVSVTIFLTGLNFDFSRFPK